MSNARKPPVPLLFPPNYPHDLINPIHLPLFENPKNRISSPKSARFACPSALKFLHDGNPDTVFESRMNQKMDRLV